MKKLKLNLCSIGEPTNPKTWSGTPYNLYLELIKNNYLEKAFDSTAIKDSYKKIIPKAVSKIYYRNSIDTERGFLFRYLNANRVKNETTLSGTNSTLHTGTLDLPFLVQPNGQNHYLYCDTTWNLWLNNSTNIPKYSKNLLLDAEKLEKKSYQQMRHIFSISEYVKENLINHYNICADKITVVGTGLGVIKPYHGEKDYNNGKILFAAKERFEDKGGHLVLEAFKIASKKNPDLELSIVGQNDYTGKINLSNVKTFGFIPLEDLQSLFNASSLFLMPALNEPWGLVYLEALACKMPIVGLNKNSFPEISDYGKYGFGLDDNNPEKLANVILDAFDDTDKLSKMGQKSQEYCLNKFTWQKTVAKLVQTIETIEE